MSHFRTIVGVATIGAIIVSIASLFFELAPLKESAGILQKEYGLAVNTIVNDGNTTSPSIPNTGYDRGAPVTINAFPSQGWDITSPIPSVKMDTDSKVENSFQPRPLLTVNVSGKGNNTLDPTPGPDGRYARGTSVGVHPAPDPGWEIGATIPPIKMDADNTVDLVLQPTLFTLKVRQSGPGKYTLNPCPRLDGCYLSDASYASGTIVTINLFPEQGWEVASPRFSTITMDSDKTIKVIFRRPNPNTSPEKFDEGPIVQFSNGHVLKVWYPRGALAWGSTEPVFRPEFERIAGPVTRMVAQIFGEPRFHIDLIVTVESKGCRSVITGSRIVAPPEFEELDVPRQEAKLRLCSDIFYSEAPFMSIVAHEMTHVFQSSLRVDVLPYEEILPADFSDLWDESSANAVSSIVEKNMKPKDILNSLYHLPLFPRTISADSPYGRAADLWFVLYHIKPAFFKDFNDWAFRRSLERNISGNDEGIENDWVYQPHFKRGIVTTNDVVDFLSEYFAGTLFLNYPVDFLIKQSIPHAKYRELGLIGKTESAAYIDLRGLLFFDLAKLGKTANDTEVLPANASFSVYNDKGQVIRSGQVESTGQTRAYVGVDKWGDLFAWPDPLRRIVLNKDGPERGFRGTFETMSGGMTYKGVWQTDGHYTIFTENGELARGTLYLLPVSNAFGQERKSQVKVIDSGLLPDYQHLPGLYDAVLVSEEGKRYEWRNIFLGVNDILFPSVHFDQIEVSLDIAPLGSEQVVSFHVARSDYIVDFKNVKLFWDSKSYQPDESGWINIKVTSNIAGPRYYIPERIELNGFASIPGIKTFPVILWEGTPAMSVFPGAVAFQRYVTYTVQLTNTGSGTAVTDSIALRLPPGSSYVSGSTDGGIISDPVPEQPVYGPAFLRWSPIPGITPGGSLTIIFQAQLRDMQGPLYSNVTVYGQNYDDFSTGPVAVVLSPD